MAVHLIIGFVVGVALTWPRVTPQAVYYGDMQRHIIHADKDCPYSSAPTFSSRADAKAAKLRPCPHCLPRDGKQVASGNRQSSDGKAKNDVPKLTRHADVIGAR